MMLLEHLISVKPVLSLFNKTIIYYFLSFAMSCQDPNCDDVYIFPDSNKAKREEIQLIPMVREFHPGNKTRHPAFQTPFCTVLLNLTL
jgi:hypothetical protein